MQLSSIFLQGLLLSGIIASPVAATSDALPDSFEGSYADNSTDLLAVNKRAKYYLCFDAFESGNNCYGKNRRDCSNHQQDKGLTRRDAGNFCDFWCSKVRNVDDCKTRKKWANYHPKWACKDQKYC
ncbi:putative secreted protein [Wickerhamomyces ciferrii]|uniref:Secreted protein n=1 Tax=Wickerhamomyces ciferrii (strain ATCC 14091 / BCRC 22168 / CBS 111 / JCM 3599 / NBRC 0793 / NRRL Y-1031 F-60-10) TaxID=1206466 RepID=K0L098_WICCF|nr:uncharacterized protein BN7_6638 [Wickerhamomyces ciferrii]CCH47029.1 putative secreted protein [Wickerhamomyces ciferrii]